MNLDLANLIAFSIAAFIIAVLTTLYTIALFRNRSLFKEALKYKLDIAALSSKLEELMNAEENKSVEKTEGFLRFISESREWAFEYIENIQTALSEYKESMLGDNHEQTFLAYKKLLSFLPEEDKNN